MRPKALSSVPAIDFFVLRLMSFSSAGLITDYRPAPFKLESAGPGAPEVRPTKRDEEGFGRPIHQRPNVGRHGHRAGSHGPRLLAEQVDFSRVTHTQPPLGSRQEGTGQKTVTCCGAGQCQYRSARMLSKNRRAVVQKRHRFHDGETSRPATKARLPTVTA